MKHDQNNPTDEQTPEVEDVADPDYLPPKMERALLALLSNPTQKEAALVAGVSLTTLWRYLNDPTFRRRFREVGNCAVMHATLRFQKSTGDAVAVLDEIMKDKKVSPTVRVTAAKTIYDRGYRALENDEIMSKLEEFEEFTKAKQDEALITGSFQNLSKPFIRPQSLGTTTL